MIKFREREKKKSHSAFVWYSLRGGLSYYLEKPLQTGRCCPVNVTVLPLACLRICILTKMSGKRIKSRSRAQKSKIKERKCSRSLEYEHIPKMVILVILKLWTSPEVETTKKNEKPSSSNIVAVPDASEIITLNHLLLPRIRYHAGYVSHSLQLSSLTHWCHRKWTLLEPWTDYSDFNSTSSLCLMPLPLKHFKERNRLGFSCFWLIPAIFCGFKWTDGCT